MIAARQIAFGGGGKRLPYDAEIEYLESTGTQYIDTGIQGLNSVRMEGKFCFTQFSEGSVVAGCVGESQATAQRVVAATLPEGRNIIVQRGAYGSGRIRILFDTNWHSFLVDDSIATIDDSSLAGNFAINDVTNKNIIIFGFISLTNAFIFAKYLRISEFKFFIDDTFALDLIPVRVGDVGYMYDRVSGKLFGNAGTGAFVLGPDL